MVYTNIKSLDVFEVMEDIKVIFQFKNKFKKVITIFFREKR